MVDFCVKYNMYNNFDKKGAGKLVIQKITKTKLLVLRKMTSFSNPKKQRSEPYYESSVCTKKNYKHIVGRANNVLNIFKFLEILNGL